VALKLASEAYRDDSEYVFDIERNSLERGRRGDDGVLQCLIDMYGVTPESACAVVLEAKTSGSADITVASLRQEIAEIQKLNQAYLQMPSPGPLAMSDHARREQRLQEIMDELKSMTEWKEP
jgi:hypothetical protein